MGKFKKTYAIPLFIILIALIIFIYIPINKNNITTSDCFVTFSSNSQDHSIKELKYIVFVKNHSNNMQEFYLLIERPKADWYPFISSIPRIYYSDLLRIESNEVKQYQLKTMYKSEDAEVSGGQLDDFIVKVLTKSEYEEIITKSK